MPKSALAIFEDFKIRRRYDEKTETWYFSIVDVIYALTESKDPRNYWKVLKHRLLKEGNQSVTNCNQLKLQAADGKFYKADAATPEHFCASFNPFPVPRQSRLNYGLPKWAMSASRKPRTHPRLWTAHAPIGKPKGAAKNGYNSV